MADLSDCKNVNDVVYKIAARAKELSGMTIDYLRRSVASENAHTEHAMWAEARGKSRGEMIEEILCEEFLEEFPKEIANDAE